MKLGSKKLAITVSAILLTFLMVGGASTSYASERMEIGTAWFYNDANLSGNKMMISGSLAQFLSAYDNQTSSIEVAPHTLVHNFQAPNFVGSSELILRNADDGELDAELANTSWNDQISSAIVLSTYNPDPGVVKFYTGSYLLGNEMSAVGNIPDIPNTWNDNTLSINVAPNTSVTLYEDNDYLGRSITFTNNSDTGELIADLSDYDCGNTTWNKAISSFKIDTLTQN